VDPIKFETSQDPRGAVVKIIGEMGVACGTAVDAYFTRLIAGHAKVLVLDLSAVPFVSSLCMGSLVNLRKGAARSGGVVRIAAANADVTDSFKRASLQRLFDMFDTVEDALAMPVAQA
jgi:anti-anti-sigma factor